jgi:YD repeat-containing protein
MTCRPHSSAPSAVVTGSNNPSAAIPFILRSILNLPSSSLAANPRDQLRAWLPLIVRTDALALLLVALNFVRLVRTESVWQPFLEPLVGCVTARLSCAQTAAISPSLATFLVRTDASIVRVPMGVPMAVNAKSAAKKKSCWRGKPTGRMASSVADCASTIALPGRRQLSQNSPLRARRSVRQLRRQRAVRKLRCASGLRSWLVKSRVRFDYTYVYDDAGNRVRETTGGTTSFYLTDTANPTGYAQPLEVWTSTNGSLSSATLNTTYIIGDRVLGQENSSGTRSWLLVDGQENTRLLTSSTGTVTAAYNYDVFGDAVGSWSLSTASTVILFQQTMYDSASGLNMYGDATRGAQPGEDTYIESDGQGYGSRSNPITLNLLLLDDADPENGSDPSGHDWLDWANGWLLPDPYMFVNATIDTPLQAWLWYQNCGGETAYFGPNSLAYIKKNIEPYEIYTQIKSGHLSGSLTGNHAVYVDGDPTNPLVNFLGGRLDINYWFVQNNLIVLHFQKHWGFDAAGASGQFLFQLLGTPFQIKGAITIPLPPDLKK